MKKKNINLNDCAGFGERNRDGVSFFSPLVSRFEAAFSF